MNIQEVQKYSATRPLGGSIPFFFDSITDANKNDPN